MTLAPTTALVGPARPAPSITERGRAVLGAVVAFLRRHFRAFGRWALTAFWCFVALRRWDRVLGLCGLADVRKQVAGVSTKESFFNVPRALPWTLRVRSTTWTVRVRLSFGQTVGDWGRAAGALADATRSEIVRARLVKIRTSTGEDRHLPGFVEVTFTRRDPLDVVTHAARPVDNTERRFVVGTTEHGTPWVLDFLKKPHWLAAGITGSGKSMFLANLMAAIAPTKAAMLSIDLKFGVEANPYRHRLSGIADNQHDALLMIERLVKLSKDRAALLKQLNVVNVRAAEQLGVYLRPVFLLIDEVAELGGAHGFTKEELGERELDEKAAKALVEQVAGALLSLVQRSRALGIHVVVCGQRFGSDMGPKVTSVRAQLSGRVVHQVMETTTATMSLGDGFDADVYQRPVTISRPGVAVCTDGLEWFYARSQFMAEQEARDRVNAYADRALSLDEITGEDQAAYDRMKGQG